MAYKKRDTWFKIVKIVKGEEYVCGRAFFSKVVGDYGGTPSLGRWWYLDPQACKLLKISHHIHFLVYKNEKGIIEITSIFKR